MSDSNNWELVPSSEDQTEDHGKDESEEKKDDDDDVWRPMYASGDEFVIPNLTSSRFHHMPYEETGAEHWVPPGETPPDIINKPQPLSQTHDDKNQKPKEQEVKKLQPAAIATEIVEEEESPEGDEMFLLCVRGLKQTTGSDQLVDYLEGRSRCDIDSEVQHVQDIDNAAAVVLKFIEHPDLNNVLKRMKQRPLYKESPQRLELCRIFKVNSVVASFCDNQTILMDILKGYFQNQWSSGGGAIEQFSKLKEGLYRIQFRKSSAAERVCDESKVHQIEGVHLSVSLLYFCEFGEFWDHSKHKLLAVQARESPVPKTHVSSLNMMAEMSDQRSNIVVVIEKFDPMVVRLLQRDGVIEETNNLSQFSSVVADIDNGEIRIEGLKDEVLTAQEVLRIKSQETTVWRVDTQNTGVTKEEIRILQSGKVQKALRDRFKDVNLRVEMKIQDEGEGLILAAVSNDAKDIAQNIVHSIIKISDIDVQHLSDTDILHECLEKLRDLEHKHEGILKIVVTPNKITLVSMDTVHNEIFQTVNNMLAFDFLQDKTDTIMSQQDRVDVSPKRAEEELTFLHKYRIQNIEEVFSIMVEIEEDGLLLTGSPEQIPRAKSYIQDILSKIVSSEHYIGRPGIKDIISPLKTSIFIPVEKSCRCVVLWRGTRVMKDDTPTKPTPITMDRTQSQKKTPPRMETTKPKDQISGAAASVGESSYEKSKGYLECKNGTTVTLVKGELTSLRGDVYVCTVGPDMNLSKAEVGKILLEKGGRTFGNQFKRTFSRLRPGEVRKALPGELQCKQVFIGTLPDWEKDPKLKRSNATEMTKFIHKCLETADESKFKSVLFPALGTGAHKFPEQEIAKFMYEAVIAYDSKHGASRTAKDVQFVLYYKDIPSVTAFEDEEYNQLHVHTNVRYTPPPTLKGPVVTPSGTKVTLAVGAIEKEQVDVVVCATEKNLSLRTGGVGKELYQAGDGQKLQDHIKKQYPKGIEFGDVADIPGEKLQCKRLYLTSLPGWSDHDEKNKRDDDMFLSKAITQCLEKAHKAKLTSIAFPALGTSATAYPRGIVAKIMYDCVGLFANKHPSSSLRDVRFVIFNKDTKSIEIFKHEEQFQLTSPVIYSSKTGKEIYYSSKQNIQIYLETGNLADVKADVLIATTDGKLDLTKGLASRTLLQSGGSSLQDDCNLNYPRGITGGTIAAINAGTLPCKEIYLGVLPRYSDPAHDKAAETELYTFIKNCLEKASKNERMSVGIPALGTGFSGFPHNRVAAISYEAVKNFTETTESTTIKYIHFVVLPKDSFSLKAFQREEQKRLFQGFMFKCSDVQEDEDYLHEIENSSEFYEGSPENIKTPLKEEIVLSIVSDDRKNILKAKEEIEEVLDQIINRKDREAKFQGDAVAEMEARLKKFDMKGDDFSETKDGASGGEDEFGKTELPQDLNIAKNWLESKYGDQRERALLRLGVEISNKIKLSHPDLKFTVIPCQKYVHSIPLPVFIVYSQQLVQTREESLLGFTVLFKNPLIVHDEGLKVRAYECENKLQPSQKDATFANEIIKKCSEKLWNSHSNLNAISICGVRSRNKGKTLENRLCVVLSCSSKGYVPVGEEKFPKMLKLKGSSIDVDVREGYFQFGPGGNYSTDHSRSVHDPLKMGCSISGELGPFHGSMGPFVDLGNGKIGFLTCSHVLFNIPNNFLDFNNSASDQKRVVQPAITTTGATNTVPCGTVIKALFDPSTKVGMDAAVVEITDRKRVPLAGHFALEDTQKHINLGFVEMPKFNNGTICNDTAGSITNRRIVKFGGETHLTEGCLTVNGIQVRRLQADLGLPVSVQNKIPMQGQFGVLGIGRSFFEPGDSGAGVFVKEDNCTLHCIGMAIGCLSDNTAVVTPIQDVLNALGVSNGLQKFSESMEFTS